MHREMGVPFGDIKAMILAGFKSSFQPFHEKQAMIRRVIAELDRYDDNGVAHPVNSVHASERPLRVRTSASVRPDAERAS